MRTTYLAYPGAKTLAALSIASLAACSSPMPDQPSQDAGTDVLPEDVAAVDLVTPSDTVTPTDNAVPTDTVTPVDTPAPIDGPTPVDVPAPVDAPPGDAPTGMCEVTPMVAAHVAAMATAGWAAQNRSRSLLMHGCAGASRPQDCLASAPRASTTTFGARWEEALRGASLRILHTSTYATSYWTRSSADGRFVGHGTRIVDLATRPPRVIPSMAQYDPGFFPDNSGFMYHTRGGAAACQHSLLTTGMPTMVTFMEPQCTRVGGIGLYEHLGAALGGSDYYVVYGRFTADDGGHRPTLRDPAANFGAGELTRVTLMANTGSAFMAMGTASVATPSEADPIISPSTQLLMTRLGSASGAQRAFVLRRLQVTRTGGALRVEAPVIARYCFSGAKGAISYDERWFIYHHYVGAADARDMGFTGSDDPGFSPYLTQGAANVYLVDLRTGTRTRLTSMQPGQYALFPHFRSDGWIYFVVRTAMQTAEHVVASDAALVMP